MAETDEFIQTCLIQSIERYAEESGRARRFPFSRQFAADIGGGQASVELRISYGHKGNGSYSIKIPRPAFQALTSNAGPLYIPCAWDC